MLAAAGAGFGESRGVAVVLQDHRQPQLPLEVPAQWHTCDPEVGGGQQFLPVGRKPGHGHADPAHRTRADGLAAFGDGPFHQGQYRCVAARRVTVAYPVQSRAPGSAAMARIP